MAPPEMSLPKAIFASVAVADVGRVATLYRPAWVMFSS
jgi:hypothetical protein